MLKQRQTYSAEFKEQALLKILHREDRTVQSVADDLNMNVLTLKTWMRDLSAANRGKDSSSAKRPEDWSLEERLLALQQSHGLLDEALNAWCC